MAGLVALVRHSVPDLHPVEDPEHDRLLRDPDLAPQPLRDQQPPLRVLFGSQPTQIVKHIYTQRLQTLDEGIRQAVQTIPPQNRRLLTYHDSWAYFAERYGMTVIGAAQPSDFSEPSAREVANLIDQVRAEKVPAVFGSEVFPSPVLRQIADETDAQYVDKLRDDDLPGKPGDPLHSYIGLMLEDMRTMIPALGGNVDALQSADPSLVFTDGPSPAKYPQ